MSSNPLTLPTINNYGNGINTISVTIGPLTVYYSYKTPVAFHVDGNRIVVHENVWGRTTGKHLNLIDDRKEIRVDAKTFKEMWEKQVSPLLESEAKEVLNCDNALDLLEQLLSHIESLGIKDKKISEISAECADLRSGTNV